MLIIRSTLHKAASLKYTFLTRQAASCSIMPSKAVYPVENQAHLKQCGPIVKSPNDRRDYRPLTLDNGIRVLLITDTQSGASDPCKSEKLSAAALCVNVGSFSDPPDLPGLAHFLEHMVFMGSAKYPDENDFEAYLSKHGGHSNAYTDAERTVFYFEVHQNFFSVALDKFANFFNEPLLKAETVDREIEAVDKEFCMSRLSDGSRLAQIYAGLAKPGHPMGKFMWGNSESLKHTPAKQGIDVHSRLKEFRERMYSSKYMTLAVQSRDSLDDMEAWVRESFSPVKDNGLPQPSFDHLTRPYDTQDFYKLYKMVPVKKMHQVELTWCLPPTQHLYHVKPLHYLGWLVGHEGNGSLLAFLKKKCWGLSLSAGNSGHGNSLNSTMSNFVVSVKLTETGYKNYDKVLDAIFSYIQMLKRCGPKENIYREIQTIDENDFRFLEQSEPTRYVSEICENMQLYPVHEYLTGDSLMFQYDADVIANFTEMLSPESVSICLVSDDFTTIVDRTEPWFGTQYNQSPIDSESLERWKNIDVLSDFHLPEPNEFIATDFSLREIDTSMSTEIPSVVVEDEYTKVFFRQDNTFRVPKAHYNLHFISPYFYESTRRMVLLDLYINQLNFNLSEVSYAASVAQLNYQFKSFETGMSLQVNGFNHKLSNLFEVVLDYAIRFTCDDDEFRNMKAQLKKSYYNSFIKPETLVRDTRLKLLKPAYWSPLDKYATIDEVTRDDLMNFAKEFLQTLYVESYATGNVSKEEALKWNEILREKIKFQPLPKDQIPRPRVYDIPSGNTICRIKSPLKDDDNCVITNYYLVGPGTTIKSMCVNEMLVMAMEEPCFNILRTQLQLGYAVFVTNRNTDQVLAFSVTVSSKQSKFSLDALDNHMEDYIVKFGQILSEMTDEAFNDQLQALINLKRCEDSNLKEKVDRDWEEVLWRRSMFNRLDLEIAELGKLTKADILEHYKRYSSLPDSGPYKKLSIQVEAQSCEAEANNGEEEEAEMETEDDSEEEEEEEEEEMCDMEDYKLDLLNVPGKECITDIDEFHKKVHLFDPVVIDVPKV